MKNNFSIPIFLSVISILFIAASYSTVYAQENMTDSDKPKFFSIQHSNSGKISKINETSYSLELNDVSDKTILFSDRPDRIVTSVSTSDFIGNWSTGVNSFTVDAPNAVLVIDELEEQDDVIIKLFNPIYDVDKKTLKYEVIQDNSTTIELPEKFGQSTLVIDDISVYAGIVNHSVRIT
ncbi:MAG: hypothetical protein MRJ93_10265 [Nitrososphaeraceae archaeon]|nr:hypothetical protein [Nitrososphaeraceae archaeon]